MKRSLITKLNKYKVIVHGISAIELLLSIGLTCILFSGVVVLTEFLAKYVNDQYIFINGIKYFKSPSHKALNDALELNFELTEQCRMANRVVVFGGIEIDHKNGKFISRSLKFDISIDTINKIISSNRQLLSTSFKLYDWILKKSTNLLEQETNNIDFTILLFDNNCKLLCICQTRQYIYEENMLFSVQLKVSDKTKKDLMYSFYIPKKTGSFGGYSDIIRKWYFLNEYNNLVVEGPLYIVLPDPYIKPPISTHQEKFLSRFTYYLNAKK